MTKITIDHEKIKKWVIKNKGRPAVIDDPQAGSDDVGIRIDFPGKKDESLLRENVSPDVTWERFFKIFEDKKLAFLYQERAKYHDPSMSYRFVLRDLIPKVILT